MIRSTLLTLAAAVILLLGIGAADPTEARLAPCVAPKPEHSAADLALLYDFYRHAERLAREGQKEPYFEPYEQLAERAESPQLRRSAFDTLGPLTPRRVAPIGRRPYTDGRSRLRGRGTRTITIHSRASRSSCATRAPNRTVPRPTPYYARRSVQPSRRIAISSGCSRFAGSSAVRRRSRPGLDWRRRLSPTRACHRRSGSS